MTSLSDKAMLVRLSVRLPQKAKRDKEVTAQTARDHGAAVEMASFNKKLYTKESWARLQGAATALRSHFDTQTLLWFKGVGLLPSANYFDFMSAYGPLKDDFEAARQAFLDDADVNKAEAKRQLNGLFRDEDYPSRRRLASRISTELEFMTMPEEADFRVNLGSEEEARIREIIRQQAEAKIAGAIGDLWQRVYAAVADMLERIERYQVDPATGKTLATFRDSAVNNVRELVELLGKLNVTDDPDLESMRRRLRDKVCQHDADALRDDERLRQDAAAECKDILASMAGYIGEGVELAA